MREKYKGLTATSPGISPTIPGPTSPPLLRVRTAAVRATLYVRMARSSRFRRGYKVEASMTFNPDPLTVGYPEEKLYTAHLALKLAVPDEALRPGALPEIEIPIDPALLVATPPPVEVEQAAAAEETA